MYEMNMVVTVDGGFTTSNSESKPTPLSSSPKIRGRLASLFFFN
jgi:hypothetical protein